MKLKQHKDNFIAKHGQEKWNLVMEYKHKNNRTPEAVEANRLHCREVQGRTTDEWNCYGIYEGKNLLYIGKTGSSIRWNEHKAQVKKPSKKSSPVHRYMNSIIQAHGGDTDTHFQFKVLETFNTEIEAELREKVLIETLQPPFNIRRGGGGSRRILPSTRPVITDKTLETR